jgi:hypothetical protein
MAKFLTVRNLESPCAQGGYNLLQCDIDHDSMQIILYKQPPPRQPC